MLLRQTILIRSDNLLPCTTRFRFELADALFIGSARWLEFHEVAKTVRWQKLAALRARLEADPAVAYATALESGESAAGGGACLGHVPLAEVITRYGA